MPIWKSLATGQKMLIWREGKIAQFKTLSAKSRVATYCLTFIAIAILNTILDANWTISFVLGFCTMELALLLAAIFLGHTIGLPPGSYVLRLSEFCFSKKFYETVCMASISDMREEYFDALDQDRIWKARWVRIRGTYSFFAAIGLDRAFAFVSFFIKAWKSVN